MYIYIFIIENMFNLYVLSKFDWIYYDNKFLNIGIIEICFLN